MLKDPHSMKKLSHDSRSLLIVIAAQSALFRRNEPNQVGARRWMNVVLE
jgi:hypothetical protein